MTATSTAITMIVPNRTKETKKAAETGCEHVADEQSLHVDHMTDGKLSPVSSSVVSETTAPCNVANGRSSCNPLAARPSSASEKSVTPASVARKMSSAARTARSTMDGSVRRIEKIVVRHGLYSSGSSTGRKGRAKRKVDLPPSDASAVPKAGTASPTSRQTMSSCTRRCHRRTKTQTPM